MSQTQNSAPPETPTEPSRNRAHTFTASSFSVVRLEDIHEIGNLKADLVACYRPVNSQEMFALERMAIAQQFILRAARLDAGLFTAALNDAIDTDNNPIAGMVPDMIGGDIEITRQQNRNFYLAEGFRRIAKESDLMNLALRYRIQAERDYRRALEEFLRLERLRPKLPNQTDLLNDPDGKEEIAQPWQLNPWIPKPPAQNGLAKQDPNQPAAAAAEPLPYIPEPAQPVDAPQASFTKALAAGAGLFDLPACAPAADSGFALRNNKLVPISQPEGRREPRRRPRHSPPSNARSAACASSAVRYILPSKREEVSYADPPAPLDRGSGRQP